MSLFLAAAWVFAASMLHLLLYGAFMAARHEPQGDIVTGTLCQVIAFSLTLFGIMRFHAPDGSIREAIGLRPTSAAFFPLSVVFGVAVTFPASALVWLITSKFPLADGASVLEETYRAASAPRRALVGFLVCFVGPFVEEMIFRGAILGPLRSTVSRRGAIVATAFLFALVHFTWQYMIPIFALGGALALLRTWSGSLVVSVVAHASFNAVALVSLGSAPSSGEPAPSVLVVVVATLLAALALGLSWFVGTRSDLARRAREGDA